MHRSLFLGALAVILLAAAHPAWAVSIAVTDGFLEHNSNRDVHFELRSETHIVSCTFCGDFMIGPAPIGEGPLPSGTTQTPPARALIGGPGSVIVNGIAFPPPTPHPFGTFNFSVGPLVVPGLGITGLQAPFTFAGTLSAVNPEGSILDLSLTGQGLSNVIFESTSPGAAFITKMSFTFTDSTGEPVIPEPSTVLLVASGLAGLGLWRQRT
jgi:hypothetical protein